jgi:L-2-hydroxycarboxylate dehydrogenase (NAD+)
MSSRILQSRNYPPQHGIIVPIEHQGTVIRSLLGSTSMRPSDADFLADVLLNNDVRCLYSHGSRQLPLYVQTLNDGEVNPEPQVSVTSDYGATAVIDGDGGLGYMACRVGMERVLAKTHALGTGTATTSNHYHIGAAGNWVRMAVEQGFIGMAMSCHHRVLDPEQMVMGVVTSSPLSIGFPSADQPPFILDMGGGMLPAREDLTAEMPQVFFKALGIGAAVQSFSGVLAGVFHPSQSPGTSRWTANQGSFLCAWDVSCFMKGNEFTTEMDRYVSQVRAMQPFPGLERTELPGGMEWQWDRDNRQRGAIALGDEHRQQLEEVAASVGVDCGYEAFDGTQF